MISNTELERRMDRIEDVLRAYGYRVVADPMFGQEELFVDEMHKAMVSVGITFSGNARRYGYRGKSKRALSALHDMLPNPGFGVEVIK